MQTIDTKLQTLNYMETYQSSSLNVDYAIQNLFSEVHEKSTLPFRVIKFIFDDLKELFIPAAMDLVNNDITDRNDKYLTSSCINTVKALSVLFFGHHQAKKADKIHHRRTNIVVSEKLSLGETWKYTINNVFDSVIFCRLKEDKINLDDFILLGDNEINEKVFTYIVNELEIATKEIMKSLTEKIRLDEIKLINKEVIIQPIQKLNFYYNQECIMSLKNELEKNKFEVTIKNSFIYLVAIVIPNVSNIKDVDYDHGFVLEQFFCEKDQTVRYRMYQSWINQTTLSDDLEKRAYGYGGENSWTNDELIAFLMKLEKFCCYIPTHESYQECFGYICNYQRPLVRFEDECFGGTTLRYYSHQIDPKDCLSHLSEIIKSDQELQKSFLEHISKK